MHHGNKSLRHPLLFTYLPAQIGRLQNLYYVLASYCYYSERDDVFYFTNSNAAHRHSIEVRTLDCPSDSLEARYRLSLL